jgi:hypothetical protein
VHDAPRPDFASPDPASADAATPDAARPDDPGCDAPGATGPAVAVLRWPDHDEDRRRLAARGRPRVLLISGYEVPPAVLDEHEVWLLSGAEPTEILTAVDTLRQRARTHPPAPRLDDDGLLWFGGRWVDVPETQIPVVDLLVRNLGRIVGFEALRSAYHQAGGSTRATAVRALIHRVGVRLARLGLELHVVRQRGVMLVVGGRPRAAVLP